MRNNLYVIALLCLLGMRVVELKGQIRFLKQNQIYKGNLVTRSTIPGGMADVNGDLLDDLIILDLGKNLIIGINNGSGREFSFMQPLNLAQNPEWTLTGGDLNNSGIFNVITAGALGVINLCSVEQDKVTGRKMFENFYAQGSNTVDINNDGFLDYFVCDDDGPSRIFINDGNGNLVRTQVIDFTTNPPSDMSGNYGSEWIDVNNDMLPDLMIAKCRAGVLDPADPRRINVLYINNGNGTFSEKSVEYGLASGEQSWVVTFGDIDNDADLDAFEANHYGPHRVLENINGTRFEPVAFMDRVLNSFAFQAVMRDFDNDGYLDIAVAGVEGLYFLYNNKDKTFTRIDGPAGYRSISSMSAGDINDDGFIDIHAYHPKPINDLGLVDDDILINAGNNNHYVKFHLQGTQSNRSAIGAKILLYSDIGIQTRYIKGGESYGILNSLQQHFGLGSQNTIDSIAVFWPSGTKHVFRNLTANKTYLIKESGCITEHLTLYKDALDLYNTSIEIAAPDGYTGYNWSDGSTLQSLQVNAPGIFRLTLTDETGCETVVKPISVISRCFTEVTKLLPYPNELEVCGSSDFTIQAAFASEHTWSTGSRDNSITIQNSGTYTLTAADGCGNILSDTISIEFINFEFQLSGDTIKPGESATMISNQAESFWYDSEDTTVPVGTGTHFETGPLFNTTDFYVIIRFLLSSVSGNIGENVFPTGNEYSGNGISGNMIFDVHSDCIVQSVTVKTDLAGKRRIIIKNSDNEIFYSKEFNLVTGTQKLDLNVKLTPGENYIMETDANFNIQNLGFRSPRLVRTFQQTKYPYTIPGAISLLSSSTGPSYYYYFYDWEVTHSIEYCTSPPLKVTAYVDNSSGISENQNDPVFMVYPNPAGEYIFIRHTLNGSSGKMSIYDLSGRRLMQKDEIPSFMDMSQFEPGIYFLSLESGGHKTTFRILKL